MATWHERLNQSKALKWVSWVSALLVLLLGSLADPTGIALFFGVLVLVGLGCSIPTRSLAGRFYPVRENDVEGARRLDTVEQGIRLVFVFVFLAAASIVVSELRANGTLSAPSFSIIHPVFALVVAFGFGMHTIWKLNRPIVEKDTKRADWEISVGDGE